MTKVRKIGCAEYMQKRKQECGKGERRGVKLKFIGDDDISPTYVVQEIESGRTHFAGNTIFKEKEIPDLTSSTEDKLVSSEDDFIIDLLENVSKHNESRDQENQNFPVDISLRTYAQDTELSQEDEFFTDDQSTNEESNDNTKEADVKTVIKRYVENVQSTSSSQEIPRRTLNFGFPYMGMPLPLVELELNGVKKEKSPLKQFLS